MKSYKLIQFSILALCFFTFFSCSDPKDDSLLADKDSVAQDIQEQVQQALPILDSLPKEAKGEVDKDVDSIKKEEKISHTQKRTNDFGLGILFGIFCAALVYFIRPNRLIKNYYKKMCEKMKTPIEEVDKDIVPEDSTPTFVSVPDSAPEPTPAPTSVSVPDSAFELVPKFKSTFAYDNDDWSVVGTSVIGNSHISMNLPCQDNCKYEYLGDGWGIAVTSDGAGSAKRSEVGSKIVVERVVEHLKKLIDKEGWKSNGVLPTDAIWMQQAYSILHTVSEEIASFGKTKGIEYKDMSATVIALVHTPIGLLSVHIGDGRAGYKDMNGNWKSVVTPHKGEEANQTIFITSEFWSHPNYVMSGVFVPECVVVREPISAFTLMSDGCEHTTWLCNQYDDKSQKYYDPNIPFAKLFDGLCETIIDFHKDNTPMKEREAKWENFIVAGNKSFKVESDDKTLLLGVLCEK